MRDIIKFLYLCLLCDAAASYFVPHQPLAFDADWCLYFAVGVFFYLPFVLEAILSKPEQTEPR